MTLLSQHNTSTFHSQINALGEAVLWTLCAVYREKLHVKMMRDGKQLTQLAIFHFLHICALQVGLTDNNN